MVTADIECGKYHAASVFYRDQVTFAEVRESLNKLYKNYEDLSLLKESKMACWRVDDKRFAIQLHQEDEGVVRVLYIQFRPMKKFLRDILRSMGADMDAVNAVEEEKCQESETHNK